MARQIDLVTLRLFIAVCEEGSIAQAAERESLVASAVSRRISAVEDDFGAALLIRNRRGITLTPAGETLLRQAREVLRVMDRLYAELSDYASGVHGHVRVVATPAVLAESLASDLGAFLESHPQVRVSTDERVSSEVVSAVRDGMADVGLLWDASELHDLQVLPYRCDQLCLAVPAGHQLSGRNSLRFEEALEHIAIGVAPGGMTDVLLLREAARLSRTLSYRVQVSSIDAAVRFVASGQGPAILPFEAAAGHASARTLVFIRLTDEWARRQFVIITRGEHFDTAATRLLAAHLQKMSLAEASGMASAP